MATRRAALPYVRYSSVAGIMFVLMGLLSRHPELGNRVIALQLNSVVGWAPRFGDILYVLTTPEGEGIGVVATIWWCWFSEQSGRSRQLLFAGICAAVLAALLAQVISAIVVSSPKPLFDPALQLSAPAAMGDIRELRAEFSSHWNTFPSPRATLFLGMAFAVLLVSSRVGIVSVIVAAVPEAARILLGLHYTTDIAGSFFLAAMLVLLARSPLSIAGARSVLSLEKSIPAVFYLVAFAISFELARAFEDIKNLL